MTPCYLIDIEQILDATKDGSQVTFSLIHLLYVLHCAVTWSFWNKVHNVGATPEFYLCKLVWDLLYTF